MKEILETSRLRLREFGANNQEDVDFIFDLLNTPGWLAFIGDRNVRTRGQARQYIVSGPIRSYRENGFGLYLVETKHDLLRIGMCGLLRRDSLKHPDLGFAFLPEQSGRGYAREAALATVEHARHTLRLPWILAITKPGNHRSIRLLESVGMRYIDQHRSSVDPEVLSLYGLELIS